MSLSCVEWDETGATSAMRGRKALHGIDDGIERGSGARRHLSRR